MTYEEAQECLELIKIMDAPKLREAIDLGIAALKKQIPQKVKHTESENSGDIIWDQVTYGYCPECGDRINDYEDYKFCNNCGQRLEWPEDEQ